MHIKPAILYQGNNITDSFHDESSKTTRIVFAIYDCSNDTGHLLLYVN